MAVCDDFTFRRIMTDAALRAGNPLSIVEEMLQATRTPETDLATIRVMAEASGMATS